VLDGDRLTQVIDIQKRGEVDIAPKSSSALLIVVCPMVQAMVRQ